MITIVNAHVFCFLLSPCTQVTDFYMWIRLCLYDPSNLIGSMMIESWWEAVERIIIAVMCAYLESHQAEHRAVEYAITTTYQCKQTIGSCISWRHLKQNIGLLPIYLNYSFVDIILHLLGYHIALPTVGQTF